VFTLPAELRPLASLQPTLLYDLLFRCASDTLLTLGRDPDRLNGQLGITAVLHTWTRDLMLHPHVHCIVTGGALSQDGSTWHSSRPDFLFHVNVMRKLFRGKFLDGLLKAHAKGLLLRPDGTQWLDNNDLRRLLRKLRRMKWVVYCKRPFGGPQQVIRYLGQYTHRVANHRLVSFDDNGVTFRTRDGNTKTLDPVEFLHRFVQHVLPDRFVKIRHYGLLAGGKAHLRRKLAKDLLAASGASLAPNTETDAQKEHDPESPHTWQSLLLALTGIDTRRCPACGKLAMVRLPLPDSRAPPIREAA